MLFNFEALKKGLLSLKKPLYYLPFGAILLIKLLWYAILFYGVQGPFKFIVNPIILNFWGAPYLHYPAHLVWMDLMIKQTQPFIEIVLGSIALWFFFIVISKDNEFPVNLKKSRQVILILLIFILISIAGEQSTVVIGMLFSKYALMPLFRLFKISGYAAFLTSLYSVVFIKSFFYGITLLIYPYLVFGKQGLWKNIGNGIVYSLKTLGTTFVVLLFLLAALLTIELPILIPNMFGPLMPPDVMIITRLFVDILLVPINIFVMSMAFFLFKEQQ